MPLNDAWMANVPQPTPYQLFEGLMNQIASWQWDKRDALNSADPPVENSITQTGLVDAASWPHRDDTLIAYARNFRTQLETYGLQALEPYAYLDQVLTELDSTP
jgi:hypothetical protein